MQKRKLTPEKTRKKILTSAKALFTKKGYSGTSMRDIAGHAEISQSVIHHHFGSKEELWLAIKELILNEYIELIGNHPLDPGASDFKDSLFKLIQTRFNYFKKHPDFMRIVQWQDLDHIPHQVNEISYRMVQNITEDIIAAQKNKKLRDDIPAPVITLFIMLITRLLFQENIEWILVAGSGRERDPEHDEQLYLDAVKKILTSGIFSKT